MPPAAKRAKTAAVPKAPKGKGLFGRNGGSSSSFSEALAVTPVPSTLSDEIVNAAHELIDLAKSGKWQDVFGRLDTKKELVNVRPAVREYGVLHQAAYHGKPDVVGTLIKKYGADPNLHTKHGQSVLEVAQEQGHAQVADMLSAAISGPDASKSAQNSEPALATQVVTPIPSLTHDLITAAHRVIDHAKAGSWQEVFKMLDSERALINIRPDVREFSALHQAVYHDNKEALVTLITKYGADPSLLTGSGMRLLEIAEMQGCSAVIDSLQSFAGVSPKAACKEDTESDHEDPDLEVKKMPDGSWKVFQKSASAMQLDEPSAEVASDVKVEVKPATSSALGSSIVPCESAESSTKPKIPVDMYFPSAASCRVYCDVGTTWHCMLKRANQFHLVQLLEISHESYCVWCRWGKIDTKGQDNASYFVSPELAAAAFRSIFFEKTNNKWENRYHFKQFFAKFSYSPEPGLDAEKPAPTPVKIVPVPTSTTDVLEQAHKLLDLAKAGRWTDVFKVIELHKSLVNLRPEVREYSVLHQAIFQGAYDVALKLVDQYGADPAQCTKFGKSAAVLAEELGHSQVAEKMRDRIAKQVSVAGG